MKIFNPIIIFIMIVVVGIGLFVTSKKNLNEEKLIEKKKTESLSIVPKAIKIKTVYQKVNPIIENDGSIILNLGGIKKAEKPFIIGKDAQSPEGKCIEVLPKAGKAPAKIFFSFENPKAGKYSVYIRAFWGTDNEPGCSNSIALNINKKGSMIVSDATYKVWHWVAYNAGKAVPLEKGIQQLMFENREDGIKVDQIFITPYFENEMEKRFPSGLEGVE